MTAEKSASETLTEAERREIRTADCVSDDAVFAAVERILAAHDAAARADERALVLGEVVKYGPCLPECNGCPACDSGTWEEPQRRVAALALREAARAWQVRLNPVAGGYGWLMRRARRIERDLRAEGGE